MTDAELTRVLDRLVDDVRTRADRGVRSLRNGVRMYARLDRPPIGSTPKDTVWQRDGVELWRYRSERRRGGPPLVIVHSLVNRSYIFDLVPGNSMVEVLLDRGLDVYLIDWGVPDAADAENSLETYCDDHLPEIVRAAIRTSGAETANVLGYCFGGVLALLYAAGHTDDPIGSLIALATPVDTTHMAPQMRFGENGFDPDLVIDETGNVPGSVIGEAIRSLAPTAELASYVNLAAKLWDDEYVAAHTAMDTWSRDEIPFAGAAFRQSADLLGERNAFVDDTVDLGGRHRSLSDISVPFLNVWGAKDHIVPAGATRPLSELIGSDDVTDLELDAGHVGLFIGRRAHRHGVPAMADWIDARS
ncbi:alpha/beta fold hydrolase [Ilumatobacter sp.]|uniref:alpha/beta fold hydrolase n=1 Tax=Ilumatobacter sp. TaxID=1967498 RepID=UPI003B52775E